MSVLASRKCQKCPRISKYATRVKEDVLYSGLLGFVDKIFLITLVCCSISYVKYKEGEVKWTGDMYYVMAGVIIVAIYIVAVILIFCLGKEKIVH